MLAFISGCTLFSDSEEWGGASFFISFSHNKNVKILRPTLTLNLRQKAPVSVLRYSAVCVYCPDLIYDAQRASEPGGRRRRPSTVNLNQADMASFGQEHEKLHFSRSVQESKHLWKASSV